MAEWNDRGFAYASSPEGTGKFPGIIILMEAFGVNDHFRNLTARLSSWGMVAVTPDLYHRLPRDRRIVSYGDRETAMNNLSRMKDEEAREDISRALRLLKEDPRVDAGRIGVVGFCMGGRLAFLSSEWFGKDIHCAVAFYGGGIGAPKGYFPGQTEIPLAGVGKIEANLLLFYGESDSFIPAEERRTISEALEKAGKKFRMITYPGAEHGFFCEDRPSYHRESAMAAENEMKSFLSSCLGFRVS
ncbi:MAG: dienelactone hydrolase family protein [Nitrospirae bacterium]|nr:dienelactone hydrolase family protein [Nitrospirota bacterium]